MHPIDEQNARRDRCRDEIFRADYIESAVRRQQEIEAYQNLLWLIDREWIDHDRSRVCPVLPGTRILVRIDPNAVKLRSQYPERLDWSQITAWKVEP